MRELSHDERNLLRHYAEQECVVKARDRSAAHHRLLHIGYIKEYVVAKERVLVSVTDAGRRALQSPS
jgi:hypothetical protein